jgi:hypothetical protein
MNEAKRILAVAVGPLLLGASQLIIDLAQGQKNVPTFSPITDFVRSDPAGALCGYGAAGCSWQNTSTKTPQSPGRLSSRMPKSMTSSG